MYLIFQICFSLLHLTLSASNSRLSHSHISGFRHFQSTDLTSVHLTLLASHSHLSGFRHFNPRHTDHQITPRRSSNEALFPSLSLSLSRSAQGGWGCGWYWVCGAMGSCGVMGSSSSQVLGLMGISFTVVCVWIWVFGWVQIWLLAALVCCGGATATLI